MFVFIEEVKKNDIMTAPPPHLALYLLFAANIASSHPHFETQIQKIHQAESERASSPCTANLYIYNLH